MNKSDLQCDIAIVGGGITGLCAAYRIHELLPEHSIRVFERNSIAGGRIFSAPLSTHPEQVDLGAGRYNVRQHTRLHKLIEDLGIRCVPFDYDIAPFQNGLFDHTKAQLREICNGLRLFFESCAPEEQERWSFWEGANRHLGSIQSNFIITASGYDSLRNPKLPFKHGIDILFNHPETGSLARANSGEWMTPLEGFQSVPNRLASKLSRSCSIDYHHTLRAIQPLPDTPTRKLRLHFDTLAGNKTVDTRHVIHASTVHDFLQIDGCNLSKAITENIVTVPLVKGYVEYESPWWKSTNIAGQCFTNPSPFRKIYFPRDAPYLLIYADGENALNLKALITNHSNTLAKFEDTIRHAVPFDVFGGRLPQPIKQEWRFWERGICFWEGGLNLLPGDTWSYAPNIHVCSDLFTDHVGWIEGGIVSAEAAAQKVVRLLQYETNMRIGSTEILANLTNSVHSLQSSLTVSLPRELVGPTA
ncbi:FAD-dependent oxidoreductase [Chitinivorax sp. B]|uniref:flavin monoamine oxidase family protein n=1 Tax=Chitinivorax sp. B TaxID=2502235 RepID=UPI0010FA5A0A|nr:FAD-dependent oxidoreductase [Chitinivorax sp. B]